MALGSSETLKQNVILGYSDINNAGLYVVSGVEETCIVEHQTYHFNNTNDNTSNVDEGKKIEIKIYNTKDRSFVKIQELPSQNKIIYLADALINQFCQNEVTDVIIVSSINFSVNAESVYLGCIPDSEEVKNDGAKERKSNSSYVYEVGILRLLVEGLKAIVPDIEISMDKVLDTKVKKESFDEIHDTEKDT
ncbi:23447_t:CDS:2, partial [Cetraspora pellucida]